MELEESLIRACPDFGEGTSTWTIFTQVVKGLLQERPARADRILEAANNGATVERRRRMVV